MEDIDTFKRYAIKREPLKMRHPQLKHESIVYDALAGGRKRVNYYLQICIILTMIVHSWYTPMLLARTA